MGGVCLELVREGNRVRFVVDNQRRVPATLRMRFPVLDNMRSSLAVPLLTVVDPRSSRRLLSIEPVDDQRSFRWQYEWSWRPGVLNAEHDDDVRYLRPWAADQRFVVGQSAGGRFSHRGKSRYSFDFSMPEGTPIFAAREGVVVNVVDNYRRGGTAAHFKKLANRIHILHDDGSIGRYLHLRHGGALVRAGQKVRAGDPIAYSGNTGYSQGPHLHFSVHFVDAELDWQSIEVRFGDGTRAGFVPRTGEMLQGSIPVGAASVR